VVGAEERLEAGRLRAPDDRKLLVVAQALLGLDHQGKSHDPSSTIQFDAIIDSPATVCVDTTFTNGYIIRVMRTNTVPAAPAPSDPELVQGIVDGFHDIIGGFRCAGTGRLVKLGVSMTHMHVLWMLQHHGDLPMSRVADLLDVSFSNATGLIDRMEERGLVERVRVPDDRRVVLVRISSGGAQALDEIEAVKQDRLQALLGRLDGAQLARLAQSFDDVRGAIAAEFGAEYLGGHTHRQPTEGRD